MAKRTHEIRELTLRVCTADLAQERFCRILGNLAGEFAAKGAGNE